MQSLSDLLTIVIPVKNEEKNLPACLENVREFKHVVLVDSGSTDRTLEIFKGIRDQGSGIRDGWEIVDFKWDGKFPKKRNWVLRNYKFKTPWALFLDADERVTEAWKREAEALLCSPEADKYDVIKCSYDNWFMGRMLRHGDLMQKTAMVRVGTAEYEKIDEDNWSSLDMEIHEHLQARRKDAEGWIRARMEHYDKRGFESHVAKHREYAKWEANRYRSLTATQWKLLTMRQKMKYRFVRFWWFGAFYFFMSYVIRLSDGRFIVIDGGFCKAYQPTSGIAGYTLIFNSNCLRIVSHQPFSNRHEAVYNNYDIVNDSNIFERMESRMKIAETDQGRQVQQHINDLMRLLEAYTTGAVTEDHRE